MFYFEHYYQHILNIYYIKKFILFLGFNDRYFDNIFFTHYAFRINNHILIIVNGVASEMITKSGAALCPQKK